MTTTEYIRHVKQSGWPPFEQRHLAAQLLRAHRARRTRAGAHPPLHRRKPAPLGMTVATPSTRCWRVWKRRMNRMTLTTHHLEFTATAAHAAGAGRPGRRVHPRRGGRRAVGALLRQQGRAAPAPIARCCAVCPVAALIAPMREEGETGGEQRPRPYIVRPPLGARRYAPGEALTFGLALIGQAAQLFPYVVMAAQGDRAERAGPPPGRQWRAARRAPDRRDRGGRPADAARAQPLYAARSPAGAGAGPADRRRRCGGLRGGAARRSPDAPLPTPLRLIENAMADAPGQALRSAPVLRSGWPGGSTSSRRLWRRAAGDRSSRAAGAGRARAAWPTTRRAGSTWSATPRARRQRTPIGGLVGQVTLGRRSRAAARAAGLGQPDPCREECRQGRWLVHDRDRLADQTPATLDN